MKKYLAITATYLAFVFNVSADITSHLQTYSKLDCSFEERQASDKKNKRRPSGRPHPHMPVEKGTSVNWCGYAAANNIENPTNGTVRAVSGTWTVPSLAPTHEDGYTAIWVGIDGYSSPTVEQLGTEHDWNNGVQQNSAWYEMYPNPSFQINGFPLDVGDVIQAEVIHQKGNQFQLSIVNHTKNVFTVIPGSRTKSNVAKRSSAEWIVEAPYSSEVLPLSDFQEIAFTNCTAIINGVNGGISHQGCQADALTMSTAEGLVKAAPSNLEHNNESFTVTWAHE